MCVHIDVRGLGAVLLQRRVRRVLHRFGLSQRRWGHGAGLGSVVPRFILRYDEPQVRVEAGDLHAASNLLRDGLLRGRDHAAMTPLAQLGA